MKTSWTSHTKEKDLQEEIKRSFDASIVMRKRLIEMLRAKQESSWNASSSKDGYDNPNWAYLQADARGYERAIKEILSLLV